MELSTFIDRITEEGIVSRLMQSPFAQFGRRNQRFLGATLMPEVVKGNNNYREHDIRYRTIIANSGTRYSRPQKKGSALFGSMEVELGDSDTSTEFTSQDYDRLMEFITHLPDSTPLSEVPMDAMAVLLGWSEATLLAPLLQLNEKQRWDAICSASVVRTGDNGYTETVAYANPAGHRVNVGGDWTNASYDPMDDIMAMVDLLTDKGFTLSRIVTSNAALTKLRRNQKMAERMGTISVMSGTVAGLPANVTKSRLNEYLSQEDLPPIEKYDLQYRLPSSTARYLPADKMVFFATTGRDQTIDYGDNEELFLKDMVGYVGIGRPANRSTSGRAVKMKYDDGKGASLEAEAWQTSLPVIQEPEAIAVLSNI